MESEVLKTTKIELRSVLLSMPLGATYKQLYREYKKRIGHDIPFRQCGHDRLDKFLRDIPDVIRIAFDTHSNETKLYGVSDESTSHIERMVSVQKVNY